MTQFISAWHSHQLINNTHSHKKISSCSFFQYATIDCQSIDQPCVRLHRSHWINVSDIKLLDKQLRLQRISPDEFQVAINESIQFTIRLTSTNY
eukprot:c47514_g1_i1 orf=553-834(-)